MLSKQLIHFIEEQKEEFDTAIDNAIEYYNEHNTLSNDVINDLFFR